MGDVAENLRRCRALGDEAGEAGADWIVLPEFFTTGMAFADVLADAALPPEGAGTQLLRELAQRHGAIVCGSFICRDEDGENRNAWLMVASDGRALLAWRDAREGPGIVVADVQPECATPTLEPEPGFWLHPRGVLPAAAWAYQRAHGRRWYRRHAVGRPVDRRSLQELVADPVELPGGLEHA